MATTNWQQIIDAALADPKRHSIRWYMTGLPVRRGTVRIESGISEYTFEQRFGIWRLSYASHYGSGSFITGEGCDASGYVIKNKTTIAILNALTALNQN